jgi:hypothetical protein
MTTGMGAGSRPQPRKKSAWKFRLLMTLLVFGGGFYAGTYATKRVTAEGPAWLQTVFGVKSVATAMPAPAQNAPMAPAAQPAPTTPQAAAPAPPITQQTPNPATANGAPPAGFPGDRTPTASPQSLPNSNTAPSANRPAPQPADNAANNSPVDNQVNEYNSTLRRVQEAYRAYMNALQRASKTNLNAGEAQVALDQRNNAGEELVAGVQRAQVLYDAIHGDPEFVQRYIEKEQALTSSQLPQSLPELSVDHLRFIRKK